MTEQQRVMQEMHEKAKAYKSPHDPERVFYLINACNIMKDFIGTAALAASFMKELQAMNMKQVEQDAKDAVEQQKRLADALAESDSSPPPRAPSMPPRPTSPTLADRRNI